ncbi:hypothetical protein [Catellatospora sp. NPDC049609]|uniref:hypothetical protein n=1 Tax=Catellatospora sp. NPDC049609 TaxID=3155505 RepID=UPI0034418948
MTSAAPALLDTPPTDAGSTPRLWRRAGGLRGVAAAFVVVAALRCAQLVAVWVMAPPDSPKTLWQRLLLWDGGWLINVAVEGYPSGYTYRDGEITGNGFAFFPLFPLLVRGGTALGLPPDAASLLVANVAALAAGVLVYLLGVSVWSRRVGYALVVLVCAQPMAVVLSMGYTESLFLALVAGALLAAHERVWWAAGLAGLGAALTRPTGAAVGVALAVAALALWWQARRGRVVPGRFELPSAFAAAALALAGVPAFLAWVGWRVGEWDAWFTVQTKGWGTTFDFGASVLDFAGSAVLGGQDVVEVGTVLLLVVAVLLAGYAAGERVWPPLLAYGLIALVLVVGQAGYWHSKPRLLVPVLLLCCVPLARGLARVSTGTSVVLLMMWSAFGLWFGAHMITVWPYTI